MSIERIFHCDWRECEHHVRTTATRAGVPGFLTVTGDGPTRHFCDWDCLLKHAGEKEPTEIPFAPPDA